VPDQTSSLGRIAGSLDYLFHGAGLVLAQNDLDQVVVTGQEDDVVLQDLEEPLPVKEALDCVLEVALNHVLPVEDVLLG